MIVLIYLYKNKANVFYLPKFKVCVTAAGRNDRSIKEFATVDWMAYQGAPDGGVAGKIRVPEWWTGSQCKKVKLPQARVLYLIWCIFYDLCHVLNKIIRF